MDGQPKACTLREWTLESRREPEVRIGVVLPEDGDREVSLVIPPGGCRLRAESGPASPPREIAGEWAFRCREGGVTASDATGAIGPSVRWFLRAPPSRSGGDPPGVVVRNVVAGRGFHWEQRIDPVLPGGLEIAQADGRILLVNALPIDTYLKGVITAEMGGQCPIDLLKAQCITARTWMLARTERKHDALGVDYCNDDCCQRYQGLAHVTPAGRESVDQTRGEIMIHRDGAIIDANYSKSCGGIVEAPEPVWGLPKPGQYSVADAPPESRIRDFLPLRPSRLAEYLTGDWLDTCDAFCSPNVVPPADLPKYLGAVDDGADYFRWTVEYEREGLEAILRTKFFERTGLSGPDGLGRLDDLVVTQRGESGRATAINVIYRSPDGRRKVAVIQDQYWIRHALHEKFLYSSAFQIECHRDANDVIHTVRLVGAGWGHGAGLCQIGAVGMALQGYDYRAILHHYFCHMHLECVYA